MLCRIARRHFTQFMCKDSHSLCKERALGSLCRMANRLADETSPYLLQHKDNPVDWYPWGEEALARAREEDRPILLSIGYSACHWCHVMERESFEDPETAALMNERFVAHQARPRGAARPRLDLHGGLPGDDRAGRLAAQRLPHPRAGALLRRHLLPAGLAHGHAELALGARGGREGLGRPSRGDPRGRRADRRAPSRRRPARALGGAASTRRALDAAVEALRAQLRPRATAASAGRRSSRPPRRSSSCCAAARPR